MHDKTTTHRRRQMSTMGDLDPTETIEWVDALSAVQQHRGSERTVGGDAVRHRLRPFLARADRDAWRRPAVHPGPQLAGHLCTRLPRRATHRSAAAELPSGDRRQGHPVVPAPVADARLLAVSD